MTRGTRPAWRLVSLLFLLALGLRLVVWQWREFYPLGGDEQEYLQQAITLLQERQYVELQLMRPPLYPLFLAGAILVVDSLVQHLRLVQAFISAATVVPVWLLAREVFGQGTGNRRQAKGRQESEWYAAFSPFLAALFCALSYTLAAYATELLTETLFFFGATTFFWLLLLAGRTRRVEVAIAAGLVLGALCLLRSVALPLLPLGLVWLVVGNRGQRERQEPRTKNQELRTKNSEPPHDETTSSRTLSLSKGTQHTLRSRWWGVAAFVLATLLMLLPWTARNYATYSGLIIIDTTGGENLWLDNDPAGREAVKAQLYALGDDRLARQQVATSEGVAAIVNNPVRFATKAWRELLKFFALEQSDDMRDRQAIWLPPAEVWARLVLGDGLWLVVLLAGVTGLTAALLQRPLLRPRPAWLFLPWVLYTAFTAMLFHTELRYRLPLYPVLLSYAAMLLTFRPRTKNREPNTENDEVTGRQNHGAAARSSWRSLLALVPALLIVVLMLLHRPYPTLAWNLGWKHWQLGQAEQALQRGDATTATTAAMAALQHDESSALARVALARAEIVAGNISAAEAWLQSAIAALPAHPYAHLLLGDLLRQQGDDDAARTELDYEAASLQDLQAWSWQRFTTPAPATLDIGGGLDLGFVDGFYLAEADGWRWTTNVTTVRLAVPVDTSRLVLRLASGRPAAAPAPQVDVQVAGRSLGQFTVATGWQEYALPLPTDLTRNPTGELVIELRSETFTPRTFDPTSPDGRRLGVMVDTVALRGAK